MGARLFKLLLIAACVLCLTSGAAGGVSQSTVHHEEEKEILKSVRGVAVDYQNEPTEGVLVELFHRRGMGEHESIGSYEESERLVASSKTLRHGKFSFKYVEAGEYELRCSKSGMATVWVRLRVNPRARGASRKRIEIMMSNAI